MNIKGAIRYLHESRHDEMIEYAHQEIHNCVLDVAIRALEKQIAKEVIESTDPITTKYFCPNCGRLYWKKLI